MHVLIYNIPMLVKDKLKTLRKDMHITAAELADRIGVTQATISRYENGYIRRIPDDVLEQIADALDTSMEELTSDDPVYSHLHKDQYKKEKNAARADTDQKLLAWYHMQSPEVQEFIQRIISSDPVSQ